MNHMAPGHPGDVTAELLVSGMHCQSCVALVQEVVADIAGVSWVHVELQPGTSEVRFDPALVGADQLCAVIGDLGYSASLGATSI